MFVEMIQKLIETKTSTIPWFFLTVLRLSRESKRREEESLEYGEVPGDNFPNLLMR